MTIRGMVAAVGLGSPRWWARRPRRALLRRPPPLLIPLAQSWTSIVSPVITTVGARLTSPSRPSIRIGSVWSKKTLKSRKRSSGSSGRARCLLPIGHDPMTPCMTPWRRRSKPRSTAPRRASPNPGRPPIHRLNRVEYRNAVRDLLTLEIDERDLLPPDESGYGFDNIADVLSLSPVLLDRYMVAAERSVAWRLGILPFARPSRRTRCPTRCGRTIA